MYEDERTVCREEALCPTGGGRFEALVDGVNTGALYRFVIDGQEVPDPYARSLPYGVHGPARVEAEVERPRPGPARPLREWVLYELHVGTFTPEGTLRAAAEKIPYLQSLGVTAIELMPLAAFDGGRGWGYDGVALYALHPAYGTPDDLAAFVDRAHAAGLAVVLDVVYNHFGPSGNYLASYSPEYFTSRHKTPWGDAPNFTNDYLRGYAVGNARYWLETFAIDGLRLDATHQIADDSPVHVVREICDLAAAFDPPRLVFAEDERNDASLVTREHVSALWADDFHHQLRVVLTRERDGYYAAYEPALENLARTIERGWLYEGQPLPTTGQPRGTPADPLVAEELVYFIQNHDHVGNRAFGDRLAHAAGVETHDAATVLLLFLPMVPLLFMGQEWAASTPFCYFTDHQASLGADITRGRRDEFRSFAAFADPRALERVPDPQASETFVLSKLRWEEREIEPHAHTLALYRTMLALRATDPVLSAAGRECLRAHVQNELLVIERWGHHEARRLVFNPTENAVELPPDWAACGLLLSSATAPYDGRTVPPQCAMVFAIPSR